MAKTKRPEQKLMYDVGSLFLILFLLKEMVKVWVPSWREGIFYMNLGCICCIGAIALLLLYLYAWMDGTARKIRELFYYYGLEGMNGYPKYLGRSRAEYMWLYGKHIVTPKEKTDPNQDVLISPLEYSSSVDEFYKNNREVIRYKFSLPGGLKVSDIGGKLEGMVQHLERETMIVYEDGKVNIIVGDRTDRRFVQKL